MTFVITLFSFRCVNISFKGTKIFSKAECLIHIHWFSLLFIFTLPYVSKCAYTLIHTHWSDSIFYLILFPSKRNRPPDHKEYITVHFQSSRVQWKVMERITWYNKAIPVDPNVQWQWQNHSTYQCVIKTICEVLWFSFSSGIRCHDGMCH